MKLSPQLSPPLSNDPTITHSNSRLHHRTTLIRPSNDNPLSPLHIHTHTHTYTHHALSARRRRQQEQARVPHAPSTHSNCTLHESERVLPSFRDIVDCVCVCEREREREREGDIHTRKIYIYITCIHHTYTQKK